jgi:hypothetical protein
MIQLGTAFRSQEPPYHRCLIISDPQAKGGQVVLVRLTTDDGTWPDRDCVLTPGDWSECGAQLNCGFFYVQIWAGCQRVGSRNSARFISADIVPARSRTAQGHLGGPGIAGDAVGSKKAVGAT